MTFSRMITLLVFVVAIVISTMAYPTVIRFAKRHNIVDNPNARKLQRVPVPIMGGVVVYIGIIAGMVVLFFFLKETLLLWGLLAMTVLMFIGIWDDIKDLSASLRFFIEIVMLIMFISMTGVYIDDFHGLWGINDLSPWISIPFSVFVGVGIINAVNLIDGVDGYSSGFAMMACMMFALAFHTVWSIAMVCMAVIVAGALLPFFLHNVFGVRSKMFIGDGGTLMLGMLMVVFLFFALSSKTRCSQLENAGICLPAMCLAVMCIPVFDTLRVMTMRILRGKSPFQPDKTHLHHLFIDMGFSHLGAALAILSMNAAVVAIWFLHWQLGASFDVQAYVVIGLGILVTFVFYKVMKIQQNTGPLDDEGFPQGTWLWHLFCQLGTLSHREERRIWRYLRWLMDKQFYRPIRPFHHKHS
ncbi:MAG: undecaprenyl/decaprenyl-phosphate alpha-N-acetylglucosaminyl 1-phosphate transferase [Prevotella sp.]|nr:undecaprenyl/decaprenyl-phosphate alpha-N-acetylglucosaminyl 1-phosphate transferase [Prevotella sp.]